MILAVIFFYIGRFVVKNYHDLKQYEFHIHTVRLSISLLGFWVYLFGKLLNWQRITKEIGVQIPLDRAAVAWSYSMIGKYFPGKVFFLLGRIYFYGLEKQSKKRITFCFLLESICSIMAALIILIISMFFIEIRFLEAYRPWLIFCLGVVFLGGYPPVLRVVMNFLSDLFHRPRIVQTLKYSVFLKLVGRYCVTWLIFGVAFFYFVRAFYPVPVSVFLFLTGLYQLAALVGIFSLFAPAGIGVREGILLIGLKHVLPDTVSVLIAITGRLWYTAGELLFVGSVAGFARLRGIRLVHRQELSRDEETGSSSH